ncbi:MAG: nicotinate phosphoribosyltransferase [Chloroflexota bacterium]
MSVFDGRRLSREVFQLDAARLPRGWYSDVYFLNAVRLLEDLNRAGYSFSGKAPKGVTADRVRTGDIEVEMQIFTRRRPFSLIAGVDEALALLQTGTGYYDEQDRLVSTYDQLRVEAIQDGELIEYQGNPRKVLPVLRIRGRYRDFAALETPLLGALAEASRVATNVYLVLEAAQGKDILFFPARFAHYKLQALHGYAYSLAVQAFRRRNGGSAGTFVSTAEQGAWWGGGGGGTIAHSIIACFLGDTAEAMVQFCQSRPPEIPRIALIDFHNDCVTATLEVMERMFALYLKELRAGRRTGAERYRLFGVRPDTGASMRDVSVPPLGEKGLDCGVNPRLVRLLRQTIDDAHKSWSVPFEYLAEARAWCAGVKIIVTGGFNPEKIRRFEELEVPVDIYGVGSWLLGNSNTDGTNNDFTADIVRVKLDERWVDMAKVGRCPCDNPLLEPVSVDG